MEALFLTDANVPHPGGKSSHICDLKDGLIAIGHNADIISGLSVKDGLLMKTKLKKLFIQPGKWFDKWAYSRRSLEITDRAIQGLLRAYLKTHRVDLISAQDPISAIYAYEVVRDSIPITLTMHSYFGKAMSDVSSDKKAQRHFDIIRERDLKSIDVVKAIIGVDTRIKEDCEAYTQKRRPDLPVYAIPNFVNTDIYRPAADKEKKTAREELGIDPCVKTAICIRRLVDKNGVIFALEAFKKVDGVVLLVGGDGPNMKSLQKYVSDNRLENKVKLLGGVQGRVKENVYRAADYAIVPSVTVNGLQEATSISAIEGMACGHVLIASGIGGLKELVQNGDNGILVDEQSSSQIADALNRLASDAGMSAKLSENARKTVLEKYSHTAGAKRYMDVFEAVKKQANEVF